MRCSICDREDRPEIDEALAEGLSLRAVARGFGFTPSQATGSIARHKRDHVDQALVRLGERVRVAEDGADLAERVVGRAEAIYARTEQLLDKAEEDGARISTLRDLLAELRKANESFAKVSGVIDTSPTTTVVNLIASPEWLRLRAALLDALEPHPEALGAVVERVRALESG
jgi:hypothetical protein